MKIETYQDGVLIATEDNRTVEEAKTLKRKEINDFRDAIVNGGFVYQGHVFDSDMLARTNITDNQTSITAGLVLPDGFTWRSKFNEDIPFDNAGFIAFYFASVAWVDRIFRASWYHKAQIDALTGGTDTETIALVDAYDYRTGEWPEDAYVIQQMQLG